MKELSGPQRKFCEGIVSALTQTEAYHAAYPKCSLKQCESKGCRLASIGKIKAEIARLRKEAASLPGSTVLTLAAKREFLARIVGMRGREIDLDKDGDLVNGIRLKEQGEELLLPDKLKAIQIDNDLSGHGAEATGNKALAGIMALAMRLRK